MTGGNVSLYNESPAAAIDPTPTVGMVGIIEDERHVTNSHFKAAGDAILLAHQRPGRPGAQGFTHCISRSCTGESPLVPALDFAKERAIHDALRALIKSRLVKSAHDCSEGGLAVALAESCLSNPEHQIGATIDISASGSRLDQIFFNETQGRIVISINPTHLGAVLMLLELRGIPAQKLGTVGGNMLKITANGEAFAWSLQELHHAWYESIAKAMRA